MASTYSLSVPSPQRALSLPLESPVWTAAGEAEERGTARADSLRTEFLEEELVVELEGRVQHSVVVYGEECRSGSVTAQAGDGLLRGLSTSPSRSPLP